MRKRCTHYSLTTIYCDDVQSAVIDEWLSESYSALELKRWVSDHVPSSGKKNHGIAIENAYPNLARIDANHVHIPMLNRVISRFEPLHRSQKYVDQMPAGCQHPCRAVIKLRDSHLSFPNKILPRCNKKTTDHGEAAERAKADAATISGGCFFPLELALVWF